MCYQHAPAVSGERGSLKISTAIRINAITMTTTAAASIAVAIIAWDPIALVPIGGVVVGTVSGKFLVRKYESKSAHCTKKRK